MSNLPAYLDLESQMLKYEAAGDYRAEFVRNAMDAVWYGLSDEEHKFLDARKEKKE